MLAIHDQFSHQMRNRLMTSGMGLGLVRLLQDAKRFEEATTTFHLLENAVQSVESHRPDERSATSSSVSCPVG